MAAAVHHGHIRGDRRFAVLARRRTDCRTDWRIDVDGGLILDAVPLFVVMLRSRARIRRDFGRAAGVRPVGMASLGGMKTSTCGYAFTQLSAWFDADHAAHERQRSAGPGVAPRLQAAELADGFVLCALAHHAGVQNDDVGIVHVIAPAVGQSLQFSGHMVAVCNVHLAADGPDMIALLCVGIRRCCAEAASASAAGRNARSSGADVGRAWFLLCSGVSRAGH